MSIFNDTSYMERIKIEQADEWKKWAGDIPPLKFPFECEIKIIPPFGGAIARFIVIKGLHRISVYFDAYDRLGYFGEPYWEIYPYYDDIGRCAMNDTDELMKMLEESFTQLEKDCENTEVLDN